MEFSQQSVCSYLVVVVVVVVAAAAVVGVVVLGSLQFGFGVILYSFKVGRSTFSGSQGSRRVIALSEGQRGPRAGRFISSLVLWRVVPGAAE